MNASLRLFALAVGVCAALTVPARASAAIFDDAEARARIEELRKRLDAHQQAVEERLAKIEASAGNAADRRAILDLAGQIDGLRAEMAGVRGEMEVLRHQIETAEKRQKDLYLDIDTRLRKLEQAQQQPQAAPEKPSAAEPSAAAGETRVYEAALNQFKLGNYALAISAFQGFLVAYPESALAPSAQYWIGNAYYALGDYKSAIGAQQKVIAGWPTHAKASDAMLNIASSQDAMGDQKAAQKTLENLILTYPNSPAAASAKQRLSQGARR
jgi:tol-pal system protein YbgF